MINKFVQASKKAKGFTLVELLVVVVIIGVLAAIAVPIFLNQRDNAAESTARSQMTIAARYMFGGINNKSAELATAATTPTPIPETLENYGGMTGTEILGTWDLDTQTFCLEKTYEGQLYKITSADTEPYKAETGC